MDWQNVPNPDDIIDIGKKKFFSKNGKCPCDKTIRLQDLSPHLFPPCRRVSTF